MACNKKALSYFWCTTMPQCTTLHLLEAPITTFSFTIILWQGYGAADPKGAFADVNEPLLWFLFSHLAIMRADVKITGTRGNAMPHQDEHWA